MSRADWSFLENLLEEGQEYSTGIGRVWLTVLFLFRMLVLGAAAESAWDDEQTNFVCNTQQPGCTNVCYDKAFPISHFRYFVLQVIFVSTPTIFYFGYVALMVRKSKSQGEEGCCERKRGETAILNESKSASADNSEEKKREDARKSRKADKDLHEAPKLKGRLLCAYALSILVKVLLEAGFIAGLWFLYNGFFIAAKIECKGIPCPHSVDCFVSRPTEKTIFTFYCQAIAVVSLLLNLLELLHLLQIAICHWLEKRYRTQHWDYLPRTKQVAELRVEMSQSGKAGSHVNLPTQDERAFYGNPCESHREPGIAVNRGPGEDGNDLLPSYRSCTGESATHSARVHYKKNTHNVKAAHKGQKRYV